MKTSKILIGSYGLLITVATIVLCVATKNHGTYSKSNDFEDQSEPVYPSESRPLKPFHVLVVSDYANCTVVAGSNDSITWFFENEKSGPQEMKIKNDTLYIGKTSFKVQVTAKELQSLILKGHSSVICCFKDPGKVCKHFSVLATDHSRLQFNTVEETRVHSLSESHSKRSWGGSHLQTFSVSADQESFIRYSANVDTMRVKLNNASMELEGSVPSASVTLQNHSTYSGTQSISRLVLSKDSTSVAY